MSVNAQDHVGEDGVRHRPPRDLTGLERHEIPAKAVGLPALRSSLTHVQAYMKPGDAWKTTRALNQKGGFDCPGCAWPDPDDERSPLGEYCENGVKAIAEEATSAIIGAEFFAEHSVAELSRRSDFELGKFGRLAEPLVLEPGATHYRPISWDDAFDRIAEGLNSLADPNDALFYTSGRTSNEAAFLYQLMVRAFGTNNLPDCSNMCHESSGVGLSETVGIGKGSVTLSDLHEAEVIMVMGQNPGTNHPRMLSALEKCKERGGSIITVNPLREVGPTAKFVNPQSPRKLLTGGTELTDVFLPVRINGDVAFLKAVMLLLLARDDARHPEDKPIVDRAFIEEFCGGYDDFEAALRAESLEACIEASGLTRTQIDQAVDLLATNDKIVICWAMGLTQHENGVDNIKEVVNLLLMRGAIGKPGAGTCPVRGHSNVQGDRTMGIWEHPPEPFLVALDDAFGIVSPRESGLAVVPAIKAMHDEPGKVFMAMGGNFLSASPDTDYTAQALRNCAMTVQVSTKLNRSHLVHGQTAFILPCLGRTDIDTQAGGEQFVSVENSMGVVHTSTGVLKPCSPQLKSEPAIVAGLGQRLNGATALSWADMVADYDKIRDKIEAVIPGFDRYNERVRQPGGFYLPNGARERRFDTATGKANFSVVALPQHQLANGELMMMTLRSHDQYNTSIYGLNDRYRGIKNERRVVFMHQADASQRGLRAEDRVHLHATYDGVQRSVYDFLVVPFEMPQGCVATYFPEANPLVPIDSVARESLTPTSKLVKITIEKAEPSGG